MKLGLIGFGYWGKKWARVMDARGLLGWVHDSDESRLEEARTARYPVIDDVEWSKTGVAGVVIATPPTSHYSYAAAAMESGHHVLVEKPMATRLYDAKDMVKLAGVADRLLMPGYTFLYSPMILHLKKILPEIGRLRLIRMHWLNRGIVRDDVDVWWNVGPHLLSVVALFADLPPFSVGCSAGAWLAPDRADVCAVTMELEDKVRAELVVSWLDPEKVRQITLIGSKGEVICKPTENEVRVYVGGTRAHDLEAVEPGPEPLDAELTDFVVHMRSDEKPRANMDMGLKIAQTLEAVNSLVDQCILPGIEWN